MQIYLYGFVGMCSCIKGTVASSSSTIPYSLSSIILCCRTMEVMKLTALLIVFSYYVLLLLSNVNAGKNRKAHILSNYIHTHSKFVLHNKYICRLLIAWVVLYADAISYHHIKFVYL